MAMRKLWYVNLEKYPSRYTWQLEEWNRTAFGRRSLDYHIVDGQRLGNENQIVTGSVLDAHGRCFYSLTQMAEVVRLLQGGHMTSEDVLFFEDMFTPGIESLGYIFDQTPEKYRPSVYVRCWAQSPDPDDFINRTGMGQWMRKYEEMLDYMIDGIFVASEELVAYMRVCGITAPIHVVGLPFDRYEVQSRIPTPPDLRDRKERVVFASRWDDEKQPNFYMDLIEQYPDKSVEFALLTGRRELDSNNPELVERALKLEKNPKHNFKIYRNLEKNEYYSILSDSKILFNCALQDWVSFTAIEADALGTMTVYPAYRSFPETFSNNETHLYVPWSLQSASDLIENTLVRITLGDTDEFRIGDVANYQSGTIDRMIDVMAEGTTRHLRIGDHYRRFVNGVKE